MGRLKLLELENFKSYKAKVSVGPFDDFTCIIGPNGSGKSNMMDAISFVLGIQSKHLRSSHLKELIFRKDATSKSENRASVKLVYELSNNELEGFESGSEITFARFITSSGVSTYQFNDSNVLYEEYDRILQRLGLLAKAKNFLVFQGDIESIASKSPADFTHLVEQISGSEQYIEEYSNLLRKKETSEESILFLMQKKKMFASQCKEAKIQKDEADLYQKKIDDLDELKMQQVLWKIWRVEEAKSKHIETLNRLKSDLEDVKAREAEVEVDIQAVKKSLANVNKAITTVEKELSSKSKQLSGITPELESTRNKLKSLTKRKAELQANQSSLEKDRLDQSDIIDKLKAELRSVEASEQRINSELSSEEAQGIHMDARKVSEYSKLREQVSGRVATQRTEEMTIEQELTSKRLQAQGLESQQQALAEEISVVDRRIQEYSDRVNKLRNSTMELDSERKSLTSNRDTVRTDMTEHQRELTKLENDYEEISVKLREAGDDKKRSKQDERLHEAIETMKRIFNGVHGKLVDLCRPIQKKYAQAISVAAGSNMDAIIVESKQVAAECIRYLKDQRIGTCLVLPLNNLTPTTIPDRLRSLGIKYKLCIDLVECDDKFKIAMNYALGATIVCDSLEDAQELCFQRKEQVRAVTLRGYVISKSGAMTGGAPTLRDGQDRWEEKDIERLRKRKVEVEEAISKERQLIPSRQQLLDLETKLKILQTKSQFCVADEKVAVEKLEQYRSQRSSQDATLTAMKDNLSKQRQDITSLEDRLRRLHDSISQVENEVFSAFSASVGVSNIREYEDNRLKTHQRHITTKKDLAERKAVLSAQLEYESKRDFVNALQRIKQQLDDYEKSINALHKDEKDLIKREGNLQKEIADLNATIKSRHAEKNELNVNFRNLQSSRNLVLGEKDAIDKKISGEEIVIEKLRSSLHSVLQKAQVEEIALPSIRVSDTESLTSGNGGEDDLLWTGSQSGATQSRSGRGRLHIESTNASDEGTESTHFSASDNNAVERDQAKAARVDLSSMNKYKNYSQQDLTDVEEKLERKIKELSADLETFQPNMHAGERYQSLYEKLQECSDDLENARAEARQTSTRFEEVKTSRQQLFQECYRHISDSLGVIYKDLTRSSRHPLGGNAYLTLDNTDEPYNGGIRYTAMPPMKRFRDMDQLSGGEKTMAALALVFSIHSYRQAPFFILDEVDAALDNMNVRKICNYIRQRSKEFQCIVISLKDIFFENADNLVGIYRDTKSFSSKVLTVDLKKYESPPIHTSRGAFSQLHATPDQNQSMSLASPSEHSHRSIPSVASSLASSRRSVDSSSKKRDTRHRDEDEPVPSQSRVSKSRSARGVKSAIAEEDTDED